MTPRPLTQADLDALDEPITGEIEVPPSVLQRLRAAGMDWRGWSVLAAWVALAWLTMILGE